MEAIAPHTFLVEFFGYREMIRQGAVVAVERGVETRNLWKLGTASKERADRRKIIRLMQRRE